jgi:hypothetical protein
VARATRASVFLFLVILFWSASRQSLQYARFLSDNPLVSQMNGLSECSDVSGRFYFSGR